MARRTARGAFAINPLYATGSKSATLCLIRAANVLYQQYVCVSVTQQTGREVHEFLSLMLEGIICEVTKGTNVPCVFSNSTLEYRI